MARKKKQAESTPGAPLWLATYGDMVTLILCFFVLLYSFSTLDVKKFEMIAASMQAAFSIQPGGPASTSPINIQDGSLSEGQGEVSVQSPGQKKEISRQVLAMVQEAIKSEHLEDEIQVAVNERGVSISMSEQLLFDETSATLHPEAARILYKIGAILETLPNIVSVEGHTDNLQPTGSIYRDNWGLSTARASAVASHLNRTSAIRENRLRAVGLSSGSPVVPNDTDEHRRLNRRVDLVILSEFSVR